VTNRLDVKDISLSFGGLVVASHINLTLEDGARTALIGPNGAGKTTLVNLISGLLKPSSGTILLDERPITDMPQAGRVRAGIARTFQINRLFKDMTVGENLRVALLQQSGSGMRLWSNRALEAALERDAHDILGMLGLQAHRERLVSNLAYGEQRLLEIALALALKPRVLLLDEPAAGVPKGESGVIIDLIQKLPTDLAVLLIEHDMDLVFRFASRIVVLASGAVVTVGTPAHVAADARVKQLYFGRSTHGSA
jgi:branched-chain amino acid transport system ATP-binding protein